MMSFFISEISIIHYEDLYHTQKLCSFQNHFFQLMECGQTGGLGEPAPLRAGEVIRTAPGTAPIRNHSTGALTVLGMPRTRPRLVTLTLVPVSLSNNDGYVEYYTSSNCKIM